MQEAKAQSLTIEAYAFARLGPDYTDKIHTEYKKLYRLRGNRHYRPIPAEAMIHRSAMDRYTNDVDGYVKYSNNFKRLVDSAGGPHRLNLIG